MRGEPDIQINRPLKDCCSWIGQRQSGKTVSALNFILNQPNPMEIWDTLGEVTRKLRQNNLTLPRHIKITRPSWVGKPLPDYETRLSEFLPFCIKLWNRQNVIGFIEEWHLYMKTKFALPAEFGNLINQGGNYNIAVWGTSQRPAQVHNDVLSACTHHFIYKLGLPQDIRWIEELLPKGLRYLISGDPKNPDALCVENMPPYHFLYYNMQTRQHAFYRPLNKL